MAPEQCGWRREGAAAVAVLGASTAALLCFTERQRRRRELVRAGFRAEPRRVCDDPRVLVDVAAVRERYCLGSAGGFLPDCCLERLPPGCEPWEDLARRLPELNRSGGLRAAVDALPTLDFGEVLPNPSMAELRRAWMILGQLSHSYCHGGDVPWHLLDGREAAVDAVAAAAEAAAGAGGPEEGPKALPEQLARPWFEVCSRLGMPLVLTSGLDIWNWRVKDPSRPFVPDNLELINMVTGTETERFFHTVPAAMQAVAATVIPKIFLADVLVKEGRDESLAALLLELADVLRAFCRIFADISHVQRDIFYEVYRPCFAGFHPRGVLLQGVPREELARAVAEGRLGSTLAQDGDAAVAESKGPSAGQSTMILLFDTFLGVEHSGCVADFQADMLGYMPETHRRMAVDYRAKWAAGPTLREHVKARVAAGAGPLGKAFDECLEALASFRKCHLATVNRYLSRTQTGTGASTWRVFLQEAVDGTRAAKLRCPCA